MPIDRAAAAKAIDAFLLAIGRDPGKEPDLEGTGARVADAYLDELCSGYETDTRALLEENALPQTPLASLVVVRDVPVETVCPHHLMIATGTATVAFAPRARLVGIGVVARVVMAHARRLTLQEEIGARVVEDLFEVLAPEWAAARLVLTHTCMTARSGRAHGARVETVAHRGEASDLALVHRALGVPA